MLSLETLNDQEEEEIIEALINSRWLHIAPFPFYIYLSIQSIDMDQNCSIALVGNSCVEFLLLIARFRH
jgi:hypothetical protein